MIKLTRKQEAPFYKELLMQIAAIAAALAAADEALYCQGYALDVTARTENAVQAGLVDGNGDPVDNGGILDNAMTAAGFTWADGWYILSPEETAP